LLMASFFALSITLAVAETLKVGDQAPLVEAKDQDGQIWRLADHVGKDAIILYFYPKDDTPGCTKEACGFRDRLDQLEQFGVSVVGVSRDDAESHQAFRAKHGLTFPLLVDTDGKIPDAFGAGAPAESVFSSAVTGELSTPPTSVMPRFTWTNSKRRWLR
jgi:thioredoxin-dependent peroxiredoxin